jgi:amino acid transporter
MNRSDPHQPPGQDNPGKTALKRSLSLWLLILYGLGNILGAGVYVLIGKVAGEAGYYSPAAFLLASIIALLTALSFAELAARYPLSAGPAVYVQHGFGVKRLSLVVGLLIVATGVVSAATIARGFVGYLAVFIQLPEASVIIGLLSLLAVIAAWGIVQSVALAGLFTLLEVSGLLLILWVTSDSLLTLPSRVGEFVPGADWSVWLGIIGGAYLGFYAYVGFEDMVNIAEEVKKPRRNLPIAIISCVLLATVLYVLLAFASLLTLSPAELSVSTAPMADIYQLATGSNPWFISLVSLFAVVNGALIQIIMASRMLYGLSREGWLPEFLGRLHNATRTPVNATALVALIIMIATLWLPIETLAKATTTLLLSVFALVNGALVVVKHRDKNSAESEPGLRIASFVPVLGALCCTALLVIQGLRGFLATV